MVPGDTDRIVQLDVVSCDALSPIVRAEVIALCESAYEEDFSHLFEHLPASVHVLARDERGIVDQSRGVRTAVAAGRRDTRSCVRRTSRQWPPRPAIGAKGSPPRCCSGSSTWWPPIPAWQLAALSPSDAAFYERRGWELWRGPLAIRRDGRLEPSPADEQVMIRRLPRTPPRSIRPRCLTAEWREGELW